MGLRKFRLLVVTFCLGTMSTTVFAKSTDLDQFLNESLSEHKTIEVKHDELFYGKTQFRPDTKRVQNPVVVDLDAPDRLDSVSDHQGK